MEVLLGVSLLIASIVMMIKSNKTTGAAAQGIEAGAQVWAEEQIAEATLKRQDNYHEFVAKTTDDTGTRIKIVSHDTFMSEMEGE